MSDHRWTGVGVGGGGVVVEGRRTRLVGFQEGVVCLLAVDKLLEPSEKISARSVSARAHENFVS